LYNGLVEALKGVAATAKVVCYIIIAIMALFLLLGLTARNRLMPYGRGSIGYVQEMNK
jgi:hypothetical protein